MYRVLKEKGNNSNVILENTDTSAQLVIGKISATMLDILKTSDIKFDESREDGAVSLKEEWNLPIRDDTGKELGKLAMRMTKPVRDQSKKAKTEQIDDDEVDAYDVLLGLASYSKEY